MSNSTWFFLRTLCCGMILSSSFSYSQNNTYVHRRSQRAHNEVKNTTMEQEITMAKILYDKNHAVKAFEIFLKYAEAGNIEAQAWLGRCYHNGIGTAIDYDKAYKYFSLAADKNNAMGINGVGVCKQHGRGTNMDNEAALACYQKAAAMNFPVAVLNLAKAHAFHGGNHYDVKLAEKYFKKAVELKAEFAVGLYAQLLFLQKRYDEMVKVAQKGDDFLSLTLLAYCHENGLGVPIDIQKALSLREKGGSKDDLSFYTAAQEELVLQGKTEYAMRCLRTGADAGGARCQYLYATLLRNSGQEAEALNYMKKAADTGHVYAQLDTGLMYKKLNDYEPAIRYLTLATLANQTKRLAIENLSEIYRTLKDGMQQYHWDMYGEELEIDFCRNEYALTLIATGNNLNIASGMAKLVNTALNGNNFATEHFPVAIEKHYETLRILADQGNTDALYVLGYLGLMTSDNHPSFKIGIELLEKAAALKSGYACNLLGNIYNNDKPTTENINKALEWYRKGAAMNDVRCTRMVAWLLYQQKTTSKPTFEELKKAFEHCLDVRDYSMTFEYGMTMEIQGKDKKKAEEIYRLGAKLGDSRCMLALHLMLKAKNENKEADDFLEMAIEHRNKEAMVFKGNYDFQEGLMRSAYSWYLEAYVHGDNVIATAHLAACWLNGFGCEVNPKAFWWISDIAYKNGSDLICLILGNAYIEGRICAKDIKKAKEYYTEGVKRGNQDCKIALDALKKNLKP